MSPLAPLDVDREVKPHFPALLNSDFIYADNAGGSQVLGSCVDALSQYLLKSNVQLGGNYQASIRAGEQVSEGAKATATLINADSPYDIVYGSSTTALVSNLAVALAGGSWLQAGDEIVLCEADHEANVGPWLRLAKQLGLTVKWWKVTVQDDLCDSNIELSTLEPLLSSKTRIVAFTACSNVLGQATPVKQVIELVKQKSDGQARTCVDCVAHAPHAPIDVKGWNADWMTFSYYKVLAPHVSVLYVAPSTLELMSSLGHYFHPQSAPYRLSPGGASYELVHATSRVLPYVLSLSTLDASSSDSDKLSNAWARVHAHEKLLGEKLLGWLGSDEARQAGVRVVGPSKMGEHRGAATISFVVAKLGEKGEVLRDEDGQVQVRIPSAQISRAADETDQIGLKHGHFYACRSLAALGFGTVERPSEDGVVRISLVHYNTLEDVDQILDVLRAAIL